MDKKKLTKQIGKKLLEIRESLKYKPCEMADKLNAYRTSYYKYETGETPPQILSLYRLGKELDISMDWLILDRGPKQFTKIETKKEETLNEAPKSTDEIFSSPEAETQRLLDSMKRFPLLRHEVMVTFYKFLDENKETVESIESTAQTS